MSERGAPHEKTSTAKLSEFLQRSKGKPPVVVFTQCAIGWHCNLKLTGGWSVDKPVPSMEFDTGAFDHQDVAINMRGPTACVHPIKGLQGLARRWYYSPSD